MTYKEPEAKGVINFPELSVLLPVHLICKNDYLKYLPVNQEAHNLTSLHQVKNTEHVAWCSHIQHNKERKDAASKDRQR